MVSVRTKKVEVLYFEGCPSYRQALELARQVATDLGIDVDIEEVIVDEPEDARRLHFLGSPSVRVDGVDVELGARGSTAYGLACRTYGGAAIPARELLVAALKDQHQAAPVESAHPRSLRAALTAFPAVGALLLPAGTCPACWPAYAALLSSVGLGFLLHERYLLPIAATLLVTGLMSLAYRAPSRRGYGPFWLGLAGALVALGGRFALSSDPLLYVGLGFFVAAAGWNVWPRTNVDSVACAKCAPTSR